MKDIPIMAYTTLRSTHYPTERKSMCMIRDIQISSFIIPRNMFCLMERRSMSKILVIHNTKYMHPSVFFPKHLKIKRTMNPRRSLSLTHCYRKI